MSNDRAIPGERLARRVYHALIEDLGQVQSKLAQIEGLTRLFGKDRLPLLGAATTTLGIDTLKTATDRCQREEQLLWERYGELRQTITVLEEVLMAQEHADMEAFAQAFAERLKADRARQKKQPK